MAKTDGISRREAIRTAGLGGAAAAATTFASSDTANAALPAKWDRTADVVVIGSGASGMLAALAARDSGSSVIIIEANTDIGGHAICSGGHLALGGGTSRQKQYGVADSPDLVFRDLTDWSVVEPNGAADYRFNDREIIRAFADNCAATFEFIAARGVVFVDKAPDTFGGSSVGNSMPRENHCAVMNWPTVQTGRPVAADRQATTSSGNGLMRPLEAAARRAGVEILLEHRMTALHRDASPSGRVRGVAATFKGAHLNVRARKAVILATGGSSGNVNFRRMFDPRLTEEYCGVAGEPWSKQDASGELAGLAIGASLWGGANQTGEFGASIAKPGKIACQYGYANLTWMPGSRVFDQARATGLGVSDWQNLILVNMLGRRFYDETAGGYSSNNWNAIKAYTPNSTRNAAQTKLNPYTFLDAALAGIGDGRNGGGPIWAIFDSEAAAREKWTLSPPNVDAGGGFFFQADTLEELARKIVMPHQRVPISPQALAETVARYNGFVAAGKDEDFGKPAPSYTISKGPFYAAWATPVIHDTRVGLRINAKSQVIDMQGDIISGLYAGGETAGGFSMHGLARATTQGFIAGRNAHAEKG